MLFAIRAAAWFRGTHIVLAETALQILKQYDCPAAFAFFAPYQAELCKGATDPDVAGDCDWGPAIHYYCAKKNGEPQEKTRRFSYFPNRAGDYAKSARTMMEENFTSALALYHSGNPARAVYFLGKAVHFICDIGCPAHSCGIGYASSSHNPHYAFEKFAEERAAQFCACPQAIPEKLKDSNGSFQFLANSLARISSRYCADLVSLNPARFEQAAAHTLPVTAQYAAYLLLRFYRCCTQAACADCYIADGARIFLQNAGTGRYAAVSPRGAVFCTGKKSEAALWEFRLGEDGAGFLESGGKCLHKDLLGVLNAEQDSGSAVKLSAYGQNRYRISIGARFRRVLEEVRMPVLFTAPEKIKAVDFEPDQSRQIWAAVKG